MKLYLINGFLGSGKTTAIQMACRDLLDNNRKIGIITNDQGDELVDTAFVKNQQFPTLEVSGGCFCCHYEKLSSAITALSKDERPEIIFAESVGSCTDLIATVTRPLNQFFPDMKIIISVFTDARLLHALMTNNASFVKEEVQYVYKKQVSEADLLIVNKIDLLSRQELARVQTIVQEEYTDKLILYQNSNNKHHIQAWITKLDTFTPPLLRHSPKIDYDVYARGEAMLAWLDQKLEIATTDGSAMSVAVDLIRRIFDQINKSNYLIGHLKFMVDDGKNKSKISYTSADDSPEFLDTLPKSKSNNIGLLINARIQSTPQELSEIVTQTIDQIIKPGSSCITVIKVSSFQPGYPRPTYRIAD